MNHKKLTLGALIVFLMGTSISAIQAQTKRLAPVETPQNAAPLPSRAQARRPASAKAWEYSVLVREANNARTTSVDGVDVTNPDLSLSDHLNLLGSQGWELGSVTTRQEGDYRTYMYYVFKRPKS